MTSRADDTSMRAGWTSRRTAVVALLVFVGCYLGARESTMLAFPGVGTPVLFPSYAVLTAALLLAPVRVWWLLILAASAGNYWPQHDHEASASFVLLAEVANITRAVVAAAGIRMLGGRARLDTVRDTAIFLAFAVALGPIAGAFLGAMDVTMHNPGASFWRTWQAWLLSNALTGLALLPLLLELFGNPGAWLKPAGVARTIEAAALTLGLSVVGSLVLGGVRGETNLATSLYGPMPFLLWAAIRFGTGGTALAITAVVALAIQGATRGFGPFVTQSPAENLLQLQYFLIAITTPLFFLAAIVQQHAQATVALRESQTQYQSVVEDQSELICRFLPDGTYTFVNGAYCRYFQRLPDELLGKTYWQFIPLDGHAAALRCLASITLDHPVATVEHEVIAPGGEIRWQQWTNRGFFDEDGRILKYQAVGRDITERKRFEEALRESENQVRLFVQHSPAAVAMFDRDMMYLIYSDRWLKDYNLSAVNLVGRSHYEVFPEVPKHWKEIHRRCLAGAIETCDEDRFDRRDGSTDWIRWEVRPWLHADGAIGGIIMFTEVITGRKRAEDEHRQLEAQRQVEKVLRASEERFRSLADNAPVLIWRSGLNNEGVYFNKPWLDFTGRTLEQELGFGWIESIHPDDREQCATTCNAAFARREPMSMQFRLRRHDGAYRWVLDNGTPYFGADGTFSGYIGSCVDITERYLAEEALQQAGRRKDEFLAMLGHELRNPLAPLGMAVEIMRTRDPSDETVTWARDVMTRQLGHLTRLVDDLLDVSRITRGKIRLNLASLDLGRVMAQAIETSRPLIVARGHDLSIDVPNGALLVRGDAVRLAQVISNLLNNAAKYTDAGGRIRLVAGRDGAQAVLTITDNGMGIPSDMLDRVFDMFTQVDSQSDRTHGGLGIGLTLVKRLVEMHGGTIEARSDGPGRGSEFIVRLPLSRAQSTARPTEHEVERRVRPTDRTDRSLQHEFEHKRILVVDDNVDAAESLSRILRLQEHEVVVAHDGIEALSAAERMRPDVVLLDIGMPGMDGLEVARRLRQRAEEPPPLLVATTGFGQAEDRRRIAEAGFDHHLVKPLDPAALQTLVRAARSRWGRVDNASRAR